MPGVGVITSATAASSWARVVGPEARLRIDAGGIDHEHGRRAPDVQCPYRVQVGLGVDLDVPYAGHGRGHLGAEHPGRAAWGAEHGGELEQA